MLILIGFIIGIVSGWLLKFAFDFYYQFKFIENKRASDMEDILVKFKMLEEMKKFGKNLIEKQRPM
jgi:hypothetical protein